MTPEQRQQLHAAKADARTFSGASKVAAFNSWTLGLCGAVSIAFGLFSLTSLVMGVALAIIARNEWVGRKRLQALAVSGLELLWRNQLALLALIVAYCIWSIVRSVTVPNPELEQLSELLGADAGDLVQSLERIVYTAVIVGTVIFQGLNARYYRVRGDRLRAYVQRTPPWILDLQRSLRE
jgi:hypothetical protein